MVMGRVLVVDDNEDVCRAMLKMIRVMGAHAECVPGGTAALNYLAQRALDLVILDYMMPDLDGLSMLRRPRADPRTRDLPVLLFTARPADELREQAAALGTRRVLQKGGIDFETLRPWILAAARPARPPPALKRRGNHPVTSGTTGSKRTKGIGNTPSHLPTAH